MGSEGEAERLDEVARAARALCDAEAAWQRACQEVQDEEDDGDRDARLYLAYEAAWAPLRRALARLHTDREG